MANRWVALAIVFVTRTSMGFQFQSVAAVAALMVAELQLTWVQLGSLIGLYMLPGAVFALPGGVLGQRFGDRRMVVVSLALMVAGGLVTAAAYGFIVAAAGRLLSGVGAVLMNILLAKMVADWFAERELSTAMGVMLTSWPVGLGIAAATLGALATHASWRTAIVATALVAALGLVLIAFAYRNPPRPASGTASAAARRVRLPAQPPDRRGQPRRCARHHAHSGVPASGRRLLPGRPRDRRATRRTDGALAQGRAERAPGDGAGRVLHDVLRRDGRRAARRRRRTRPLRQPRRSHLSGRTCHGRDDSRVRAFPDRRAEPLAHERPRQQDCAERFTADDPARPAALTRPEPCYVVGGLSARGAEDDLSRPVVVRAAGRRGAGAPPAETCL